MPFLDPIEVSPNRRVIVNGSENLAWNLLRRYRFAALFWSIPDGSLQIEFLRLDRMSLLVQTRAKFLSCYGAFTFRSMVLLTLVHVVNI